MAEALRLVIVCRIKKDNPIGKFLADRIVFFCFCLICGLLLNLFDLVDDLLLYFLTKFWVVLEELNCRVATLSKF